MPAELIDLISKNFGAFAGIIVGEILAIVAVWKFLVAQLNEKSQTINTLHQQSIDAANKTREYDIKANERMSASIEKLNDNVEESIKLTSNLLVLLQERHKL